MKRVPSHLIGIDQGNVVLFSDFEDDGPMWTGEGERAVEHKVRFRGRFVEPPAVHLSMSMWDWDANTNARADLFARDVTETGFTIVFKTWGDSRIARIRADWLAIGALADDDLWDVP